MARDKTITDSTSKYTKPSEPEYEAVKMDVNPTYGCNVEVNANPAYQATS